MIRTILQLHAAPGQRDRLIAHYERNAVLDASRDYEWLSGEVAFDLNDDQTLVVTSTWPSADNYQRWLDSTTRHRVVTSMRPLLDPNRPAHTQIMQLTELRRATPDRGRGTR